MARILIHNESNNEGKWYEQIEPSMLSETEFEQQIIIHAPEVYPHYFVVPFKKKVYAIDENMTLEYETDEDDAGTGRTVGVIPDLAFIAKDYKEWWVVEVEMGYHDLNGHVLPQIKNLKHADYTIGISEYLAKQDTMIDVIKLDNLIRTTEVQVLVILNQFRFEWMEHLNKINILVAIFEIFRSADGTEIFRANGEYPSTFTEFISDCNFHPTIPRYLGIETPDNLDLPQNRDIVKIIFNNCLTEWKRLDARGVVWLQPILRSPLNNNKSYQIYRRNDGAIVLRENPEY